MKRFAAFLALSLLIVPLLGSRSFNGSSDTIIASGVPNITSGPETVSFWVYPTVIPSSGEHEMVSHYNYPTGGEFALGFGVNGGNASASNQFGWLYGCCGPFGTSYGSCGPTGVTANQWYQAVSWADTAGVFHGSATSGMVVSGGLSCSSYVAFSTGRGSAGNFQIGAANASLDYFQGVIGEVAIWNTLLSTSQMTALQTICPIGPSARRIGLPQPLAYFPLWGASGSSLEPDESGNGHNGTLTGTAKANHPPCTP